MLSDFIDVGANYYKDLVTNVGHVLSPFHASTLTDVDGDCVPDLILVTTAKATAADALDPDVYVEIYS